jgi:hypothetical protein
MPSTHGKINTVNFCSTSDYKVLLANRSNEVIHNKSNILIMNHLFSIIHAYPLSSGDRSINPLCLNFPLAYEVNRKYVENRI